VNGKLHVCLLSAGRVFGNSPGGEELLTVSLGDWLADHSCDVTLMGIDLVGTKSKHLCTRNEKKKLMSERIIIIIKTRLKI
jgi:hypothetical protein